MEVQFLEQLLDLAHLLMHAGVASNQVSVVAEDFGAHCLNVVLDARDDIAHAALSGEPVEDVDVSIVRLHEACLTEVVEEVDFAANTMQE